MQSFNFIKRIKFYSVLSFLIPLIAINSCFALYKFFGDFDTFPNFDWEKEKWEKDSINSNSQLLIKVRQDSFNWVVKNKYPLEDLSIGFQCRIDRNPDVYNVKFWNHFTNVYIN